MAFDFIVGCPKGCHALVATALDTEGHIAEATRADGGKYVFAMAREASLPVFPPRFHYVVEFETFGVVLNLRFLAPRASA
jgi:hypothetical protein